LSLLLYQRRVFEPLTPEQVKNLIACTAEYHRCFVQLLTSGLRGSEAEHPVADLLLDHER